MILGNIIRLLDAESPDAQRVALFDLSGSVADELNEIALGSFVEKIIKRVRQSTGLTENSYRVFFVPSCFVISVQPAFLKALLDQSEITDVHLF